MEHHAVITKINRARYWCIGQPDTQIWGQLSMSLKDIIDPTIPTACTDGVTIHWNPDAVAAWDDEEVRYVLLHETWHPADGHLWRVPCNLRGNIAGDRVIEYMLRDIKGIRMPNGCIVCPADQEGMPIERIYRALGEDEHDDAGDEQGDAGDEQGDAGDSGDDSKPSKPGNGKQTGKPSSGIGDFIKPSIEPAESVKVRESWERNVIQSAMTASMGHGSIPGSMRATLERMKHQGLNWQAETLDFVRVAQSSRPDWCRANRRHALQKVFYPARRANELATMVFVRDSSGSQSNLAIQAKFASLISGALADTGCHGIVMDCDTRIQATHELSPGQECPLEIAGGGGTSFVEPFARVAELIEQGERIAGVVYLTDLDGGFPDHDVWLEPVPTLWLATGDPLYRRVPPFGRVVPIDE